MIRISNISFFRFCWKNGKLDWPKCARTNLDSMSNEMLFRLLGSKFGMGYLKFLKKDRKKLLKDH